MRTHESGSSAGAKEPYAAVASVLRYLLPPDNYRIWVHLLRLPLLVTPLQPISYIFADSLLVMQVIQNRGVLLQSHSAKLRSNLLWGLLASSLITPEVGNLAK